jgi:uncharacterized membrane protein HdeD (DUF308 family)
MCRPARDERIDDMKKRSVSDLARDWWAVGLRGVLAVIAGIVIVLSPVPHADHLLDIFGAYLLVDGLLDLVMAVRAARDHDDWRRPAVNGISGVAFGLLNLTGGGSVSLRADVIALRTLLVGVSGIIVARQVRTELPETLLEWLLIGAGIGSIIFSIVIFAGPTIEARVLGGWDWLACLYLVGFGVLLLTIAALLRPLSRVPASTAALPAAAH